MGAFGKVYSESVPQGSALANTLDTVIQNDKIAIDERIELEHQSFVDGTNDTTSATAQGRHIPGKVSTVLIDTMSNISALTGMYTGALAYDTTNSRLLIYDGSNWTTYPIGSAPTAVTALAFRAYMSSAQSVPTGVATKLVFDGESYDYGSKFDDVTNYRYTPGRAGLYLITAQAQVASGSAKHAAIYLYKNGAVYTIGIKGSPNVSEDQGSVVTDLVLLDDDDYLEIYMLHAKGSNATVNVGETQTNFSGYYVASV